MQNKTATKSKTKEIQRTYMLLFVHTLVDVAVYQLYRAVWKLYFGILVVFCFAFWIVRPGYLELSTIGIQNEY